MKKNEVQDEVEAYQMNVVGQSDIREEKQIIIKRTNLLIQSKPCQVLNFTDMTSFTKL